MDKNKKKQLLQEVRQKQHEKFVSSLPMPLDLFSKLFDYLDRQLEENGCKDNFALTEIFLQANNVDKNIVIPWLREHGGHCDCEILANVEEKFL